MTLAECLCGLRVTAVSHTEDYITIVLSEGGHFNIYNRAELPEEKHLMNKLVTDVVVEFDNTIIELEDGARIKISMRSEDYNGPEAFHFRDSKGTIIVG